MKKIWIITAMEQEAQHIIALYGLQEAGSLGNLRWWKNEEIVLMLSGIGKIQASLWTTLLCTQHQVERIINIGIAGSLMGTDAKIGEVFLVNKVSQHDMYLPFDGAHLDYAKKAIDLPLGEGDFNFPEGVTVSNHAHCLTGDQFLDQEEKIAQLKASYQAQVVEMEAFAVASVAREFDKKEKTLIIKAISDGANEEAKTAHVDNLDFAMEQSIKVLQHIIPQLR